MKKKPEISKEIIKILSENRAISVPSLVKKVASKPSQKEAYAINRSLSNLTHSGLIESISSGQNEYARLSKTGRVKANSLKLTTKNSLLNQWDGKWRIILLDLPESRKAERESLRYLLKKAGFVMLKNSVWISPYPYEYLFTNLKKDLGITTEMIIFCADSLDSTTENELQALFN
jgi:phenylacetic acid degradation operon negative regulatory protein